MTAQKASKRPPTKKSQRAEDRIDLHKDGTIRAQGKMVNGALHGYWEWFRKDGTKMRSGHFQAGKQTGEWKTFATDGRLVKTTQF
ncbi:MAG: toxin-antitoxin system YwqK family antitoxin [Limisphaerales bacterium]